MSKLEVKGRIWINTSDVNVVGEGKICLLEKVKELGSLRKAAIEMNMSYRYAWGQIYKINQAYSIPVVILHRGGKDGGMAHITETGEKLISAYRQIQMNFEQFLAQQNIQIQNL